MMHLTKHFSTAGFKEDLKRSSRKTRCVVTAANSSAVLKSLAGQPIHNLSGRRFIPLVGPDSDDSLPFAVALELLESEQIQTQSQDPSSSAGPLSQQGFGTYVLQYILDGRGQVDFTGIDHQPEVVQAGDTLLMPTHAAHCTAEAGPETGSHDTPSALGLVRLVMLLPQEVFDQTGTYDGSAHLSSHHSVVSTWRQWTSSPVIGHLTQQELQTILSRRRRIPEPDQPPLFPFPLSPCHHSPAPLSHSTTLHELPHHLMQYAQYFVEHVTTSLGHLYHRHLHPMRHNQTLVIKRALDDIDTFQLPNQTNRLALVFDPVQHPVPFTFGLEIFQAGHHTTPHVHPHAHELFFILSGEGVGFCDGCSFPVSAGDLVLFPPQAVHGIDVGPHNKMYCLEFMLPNDMFAEFVKEGRLSSLEDDDLCTLNAISC